jgi:hypothetical protein
MNYFEVTTIFGRPHVVRAIPTEEEVEEALRFMRKVFTLPEMESHPDLQDALARWIDGDRSLYAEEVARYVLRVDSVDSVKSIAQLVDDELEAWYREHAATDELAQRMATLLDLLVAYRALERPISTLLIPVPRDWSKKEWNEVEGELNVRKAKEMQERAAEIRKSQALRRVDP